MIGRLREERLERFEQRLEEVQRVSMWISKGSLFQAEGRVRGKGPRQEHPLVCMRRATVWLERSE